MVNDDVADGGNFHGANTHMNPCNLTCDLIPFWLIIFNHLHTALSLYKEYIKFLIILQDTNK